MWTLVLSVNPKLFFLGQSRTQMINIPFFYLFQISQRIQIDRIQWLKLILPTWTLWTEVRFSPSKKQVIAFSVINLMKSSILFYFHQSQILLLPYLIKVHVTRKFLSFHYDCHAGLNFFKIFKISVLDQKRHQIYGSDGFFKVGISSIILFMEY